jgi:glycerol kinase
MISDLSGVPVARPAGSEYATARGAAWIAGVASGIWADPAEAAAGRTIERRFEPRMRESERSARRAAWKDALGRTIGWRARQF